MSSEGTAPRIVIAGGGTGGHVIPALAIARVLKQEHGAEVLFIGTARGIENRLVPTAGFPLELIDVGALKNVGLTTRFSTLVALPRAVLRSRRLLRDFQAGVVLGVGGYASGPAMLAAVLAGIPRVAFESNIVPGFANRAIARWVTAAAVQFPETVGSFPNAQVTGTPVRPEFFNVAPRQGNAPPTLLIFGGSQGAAPLNRVMMEAAASLQKSVPGLRIVHQTGERDFEAVMSAYERAGVNSTVSRFIERMWEAFASADLLLCRSGASTVAEVSAAGRPAIFVPFPRAADDHQRRNAEAFAQAGAAALLPESELTPERLVETVRTLLADRTRLRDMSESARHLAHPDAARAIAGLVIAAANARH
jgi:UDP-N-acetylglucosamine--N-acetylmuramyl-(pentapeptide) pyrophosphoryl-undecaprenol N-acetylglucosamine transferase